MANGLGDDGGTRRWVKVDPLKGQVSLIVPALQRFHICGQVVSALSRKAHRGQLDETSTEDEATRRVRFKFRQSRLVRGDDVCHLVDGEGLLDLPRRWAHECTGEQRATEECKEEEGREPCAHVRATASACACVHENQGDVERGQRVLTMASMASHPPLPWHASKIRSVSLCSHDEALLTSGSILSITEWVSRYR